MKAQDDRPWLLDLFAGAGGAGEGYRRAGFHVVCVDLDAARVRHNPHECYQGEALSVLDTLLAGETWQGYRLGDFDVIHASPPCQRYSVSKGLHRGDAPMLIEAMRGRLDRAGLPFVIENVSGAWAHLPASVLLCGTMFGLRVYRHRLFESNVLLFSPAHPQHPHHLTPGYMCIYGHVARTRQQGNRGNIYDRLPVAEARRAMGIDWMTLPEMAQAVPPAYTLWIGRQLMAALGREAA